MEEFPNQDSSTGNYVHYSIDLRFPFENEKAVINSYKEWKNTATWRQFPSWWSCLLQFHLQ